MWTEATKNAVAAVRRPSSRFAAGWRRLWRDEQGATALEFSLVVIPFVAITLAIFETSVLLFNQGVVQGAVSMAARQIRTGQLQAPPGTGPAQQASVLSAFQTQVCNDLYGGFQLTCANLQFDVRSFASFGAVSLPAPTFDAQGNLINSQFNTGGSGQIVTVRVIYLWTTITPGLSALIGPSAGLSNTVTYTVVLRNEPF